MFWNKKKNKRSEWFEIDTDKVKTTKDMKDVFKWILNHYGFSDKQFDPEDILHLIKYKDEK